MLDKLNLTIKEDDMNEAVEPVHSSGKTAGHTATFWIMALLVLAGVYYASTFFPSSDIPWMSDLDDGFAAAKEKNQLVLAEFKTSGCGACVYMDNNVFSQEAVTKALSDWTPVQINVSSQPRLGARYNIEYVPTFIIFSPQGRMMDSFSGTMEVADFVSRLDRAKARWRESQSDTVTTATK